MVDPTGVWTPASTLTVCSRLSCTAAAAAPTLPLPWGRGEQFALVRRRWPDQRRRARARRHRADGTTTSYTVWVGQMGAKASATASTAAATRATRISQDSQEAAQVVRFRTHLQTSCECTIYFYHVNLGYALFSTERSSRKKPNRALRP
jgi:hypothetical protein